jgi:hypothetical protein
MTMLHAPSYKEKRGPPGTKSEGSPSIHPQTVHTLGASSRADRLHYCVKVFSIFGFEVVELFVGFLLKFAETHLNIGYSGHEGCVESRIDVGTSRGP